LPANFDRAICKPIVAKTPSWKAVAFATALGLGMLSCPVQAAPASGSDTVHCLYDALLNTMKNGRTLGQSGRFAQLAPVIRRTFDIASMTRLSVGSSWPSLTEAQRQQAIESFGRYISAIYADRFDSYAGQKLQVTGEEPAFGGVKVRSQIIKASGEPVNVDYLMRRSGDAWLISDIYLDGAISEVATRRSEFAAILRACESFSADPGFCSNSLEVRDGLWSLARSTGCEGGNVGTRVHVWGTAGAGCG